MSRPRPEQRTPAHESRDNEFRVPLGIAGLDAAQFMRRRRRDAHAALDVRAPRLVARARHFIHHALIVIAIGIAEMPDRHTERVLETPLAATDFLTQCRRRKL